MARHIQAVDPTLPRLQLAAMEGGEDGTNYIVEMSDNELECILPLYMGCDPTILKYYSQASGNFNEGYVTDSSNKAIIANKTLVL